MCGIWFVLGCHKCLLNGRKQYKPCGRVGPSLSTMGEWMSCTALQVRWVQCDPLGWMCKMHCFTVACVGLLTAGQVQGNVHWLAIIGWSDMLWPALLGQELAPPQITIAEDELSPWNSRGCKIPVLSTLPAVQLPCGALCLHLPFHTWGWFLCPGITIECSFQLRHLFVFWWAKSSGWVALHCTVNPSPMHGHSLCSDAVLVPQGLEDAQGHTGLELRACFESCPMLCFLEGWGRPRSWRRSQRGTVPISPGSDPVSAVNHLAKQMPGYDTVYATRLWCWCHRCSILLQSVGFSLYSQRV